MAPKKTTAAKKAPVKKIAVKAAPKKAPAKKIVVAQPAAAKPVEAACSMSCGVCGCRCGLGRFIKKLLVFFVIFALGFTTCHYLCSRGHRMGMHKMGPVNGMGMNRPDIFTDGCLDMNKIKDGEFAEHIVKITANADADKNGCVSVEEFQNADRTMADRPMRGQMERSGKGPMRK